VGDLAMKRVVIMRLLSTHLVGEPLGKIEAVEEEYVAIGQEKTLAKELAVKLLTRLDKKHTAAIVRDRPIM